MSIQALREERAAKIKEARLLVDNHSGDQWTVKINQQYTTLLSEIDNLGTEIDRHQRVMDLAAMDLSRGSGLGQGLNRPLSPEAEAHRRAFDSFIRTGDDAELRRFKATITTSKGSEGGFLIPEEIDKEIERMATDESAMRSVCDVKQITTPEYNRIVSLGGIESGWVGETEARPETSTPNLKNLKPYWGTVYAYPMVTQDTLDFPGFDVEGFLIQEVGSKFAEDEGDSFISGNGIKKPRGILDFPYTTQLDSVRDFGTLRYIPSGIADGLGFDCLQTIVFSLKRAYRKGATWLMNATTAGVISKMKDGTGNYLWQRSVVEGQPPTLLGYPVEIDDFMDDIGVNTYPVLFGNFKKGFLIVDLPSMLMLRDPYSNKPYVGFYFIRRMGSLLKNSAAIRAIKCSVA